MRLSEALNITVTERAVLKASSKRLLADFTRAARIVATFGPEHKSQVLWYAGKTRSRTKYAAIMTAFGL